MRLQADIPTSENANVTLLTFGDVQLQNAVQVPTQLEVTGAVNDYVNVRRAPSTEAGAVGVLGPGQTVTAVERLADSSWVRVELPDSGVFGWVNQSLLTSEGSVESLAVAEGRTPHYRPMQAFYFNSGADESACAEAPTSGILIQTPEGVGEVSLLINEVNIRIGSTVFFQAQAGGQMTVTTIEGHAEVTANGVTHIAPAGSQLHVPLNEDRTPAGPPSLPEPYDAAGLQNLPISVLDRAITVAPPLSQEEIDRSQPSAGNNCPCGDGSAGGQGQPNDCSGQACSALGQNGDCAGNSCNNPGAGNGNANGSANGGPPGEPPGGPPGHRAGHRSGNGNGNGNG